MKQSFTFSKVFSNRYDTTINICADGDIEIATEVYDKHGSFKTSDYHYIPADKVEDFKKWLNSDS